MKYLGVFKYFLVVEVTWSPKGFLFYQRKYAVDIITEMRLLAAKHVRVLMEQNHHFALSTS